MEATEIEALDREKTAVIDELINVRSNNIHKMDVPELILKYFEVYKVIGNQRQNAWENDNQAVRQLHAASVKLPRVRYFPGSQLKRTPQRSSGEDSGRKSQVNRSKQGHGDRIREDSDLRGSRELSIISDLASHMVDSDLTPQAVERQLSDMAENLKDNETKAEQLHALAVVMVHDVLIKASEHIDEIRKREENTSLTDNDKPLDDVDGSIGDLTRETTAMSDMSITRIEMIAKDMVQSVTENVTAMFEAEMAQREA